MGYYSAFLGESCNVLGFTAEETLWDEKGEIGVLHTCFLEHSVEDMLHFFPDCVSVGLDYHAASYGRLFGQIGFHNNIVIPL